MVSNLTAGLVIAGVTLVVAALLVIPYCYYIHGLPDDNDNIPHLDNNVPLEQLNKEQEGVALDEIHTPL